MTYGVIVTMAAPIETYDTLHQALLRETDGHVAGLLVHIARPTPDGFQVIEVWESKEHSDRANQEIIWPLARRVLDQPPPTEPVVEEIEIRGLVIPTGDLAR